MATAAPLDAQWAAHHRKFIIIETVVSCVLSAVLSAAFVRLIFGGRETIPLWGMDGLAFDLVPTAFMIALMTTFGLTLVTRLRCRLGKAPMMGGGYRLPRWLILRGPVVAVLSVLAFVPITIGLLMLLGREVFSYDWVMAFKVVFGVIVALVVTPFVLADAMRDGYRAATR